MADLRRREAIESLVLAVVGGLGVLLGVRAIAPIPPALRDTAEVPPPKGGWPAMLQTSEHVADYRLEAKLDPDAHVIDGKGTITLHNVSKAPLHDLRLHLYLNAFKNDSTVFRRARVAGFRGDHEGQAGLIDVKKLLFEGDDVWPTHAFIEHTGESPQDPLSNGSAPVVDGAPLDETDVSVKLPREVAPGESIELEVEFRDELPEISERTGFSGHFHFAGQWFPKLAKLGDDGEWKSYAFHHVAEFYADFGSYDVTIDVPDAYTIGATGTRTSQQLASGRRIERYRQDDVHDFAFTAWDRYVVREAEEGGVHLHFLSPPGFDAAIDREVLSVRQGLRDLGARFGEYPYRDFTVVHPPPDANEAGGMEYPTLITTGGTWWPSHGSEEVEGVTVHELGHQWFYGLVATNEVEWPSGDEGFNSFAELGVMDHLFPGGSMVSINGFGASFEGFAKRGADPEYDEPVFQPAYAFADGRSYGGRVYGATSVILETLSRTYPRFDTAMGVYARTQRFKHPSPDDFFDTVAELDEDCAAAARAALTSPTTLDLFVGQVISAKRHSPTGWFDPPGGRVQKRDELGDHGYVNVVWIGRRGIVDLPIDVELRFADGSRRRELVRFGPIAPSSHPGSGTWRRIDADGPTALESVLLDPDEKILMDRTRLDNFATASGGKTAGAPITRERALSWIELLLRGAGP